MSSRRCSTAEGDRFASSGIREALAAGEVQLANRGLGYRWFVTGTVVPGERRGRELGFPTANIRLPADCRLRHGIYAVTFTRPGGEILPAVASYGRRPQFDNGAPLLEVYVLDFAGDLYGERGGRDLPRLDPAGDEVSLGRGPGGDDKDRRRDGARMLAR